MPPLTGDQCRAIRREVKGTAHQLVVLPGGLRCLAWRNVNHRSVQVYMVEIIDGTAHHYMITTKAQWKKLGLAHPTPKELAAWQSLVK